MSGTASFTSKFRINENRSNDEPPGRVSKRAREVQVCNLCRDSKLRCDKGRPCSSCVKRGHAHHCTYHSPAVSIGAGAASTEERLKHLESLVQQLAGQQTDASVVQRPSGHPLTPPSDHLAHTIDKVPQYVGPTHFTAMLDDIADLKKALGSVDRDSAAIPIDPESKQTCDDLIFGSTSSSSILEITRRYLPSRRDADRLISVYFKNDTFVQPFIHAQHFQRAYRRMWDDLATVNPLWLSTLFSIFHMATLMNRCPTERYHTAAGHCLVLGHYHRPQPHAAEALLVYAHCKALKSMDPSREVGLIMSMAVRIAYQLGYHREPTSSSKCPPFFAELRRRFWSVCKQMDLMLAFQLGLPSSIRVEHSDTLAPRNLLDADFDEPCTELPPSRPYTDATKLLWFIAKDKLMPNFGDICHGALSFRMQADDEIARLDLESRQAYATVPDVLRARSMSDSLADPGYLILTRLYLELIHLKGLCILHRKPMSRGVASSMQRGTQAAVTLVTRIIDIHRESAPGGQLHAESWMFNAYTLNDFHLGVIMLVTVYAYQSLGMNNSVHAAGVITRTELAKLLEDCNQVCLEFSKRSQDARKVSLAVRLILDRPQQVTQNMATCIESMDPGTMQDLDESCSVSATDFGWSDMGYPRQNAMWMTDPATLESLDPFQFMGSDLLNFDMVTDGSLLGRGTI